MPGRGGNAITLIDLSPRLETAEFREVLLFLVGWRDDDAANQRAADRAIQSYRSDPRLCVLGVEEGGRLLGLIGLEVAGAERGVIRHIVVHPGSRHRGIGRALIAGVVARLGLSELGAETDGESVEFYRRCGFEVHSLGEKYPGVERFHCVWSRGSLEGSSPPQARISRGGAAGVGDQSRCEKRNREERSCRTPMNPDRAQVRLRPVDGRQPRR